MDWIGLEKIEKEFDLFGIQTHPIPLNPHGLRANRTRPYLGVVVADFNARHGKKPPDGALGSYSAYVRTGSCLGL
jgi:hypothetical protein